MQTDTARNRDLSTSFGLVPEPRAPKDAGARPSMSHVRSLALAAAAVFGTSIIAGLPFLLHRQQQVSAAVESNAVDAARLLASLEVAYWSLLAIITAAGIGLGYAVLRMLQHAQAQAAVRKEAQSMLLRAERARIDADQANADKSSFLAEAGHDLRTPLTTILGYGEMIEHELMGPIGRSAYREAAEHIVTAGRELTQRIADIIELARVEGSIARPAEHPTPLSTMVRETHAWAITNFASKRLTIGLRLPQSHVGLKVQPLLLRRIVRGLIGDAGVRTPAGGAIILSVGFAGDGRLDLAVRDTGAMPAMATIGPAGHALSRRSARASRNDGGNELGLMIIDALMQSIGGHMEVVDTAGRGSEIHLLFPKHLVVREEWKLRRRQIVD